MVLGPRWRKQSCPGSPTAPRSSSPGFLESEVLVGRAKRLKGFEREHARLRLAASDLNIEPGRPWETGSLESFNGKLKDGPPNGELLYTLKEAQILVAG